MLCVFYCRGVATAISMSGLIRKLISVLSPGLALLFFLLSLTGNLTYGASLVAYSQDPAYILKALPWLLGSLGTIAEDGIIFVQFKLYTPQKTEPKTAATVSNGDAENGHVPA